MTPAKLPPHRPRAHPRPRPAHRVVVHYSVNTQAQRSDFRQMMAFVRARAWYAGETDLDRLARLMEPQAADAPSTDAFLRVLERTLGHLGDPLARLGKAWADSPRPVPFDLEAGWVGPKALLQSVKVGGPAWKAGLRPGMELLEVDGVALEEALSERRPLVRPPTEATERWTLNALLAGTRGTARRFTMQIGQTRQVVDIAEEAGANPLEGGVSYRMLKVGVAYLRLADFMGTSTVQRVDHALEEVRGVRGLVVDLRDASGADLAAVRSILARFTAQPVQVPGLGPLAPRGAWGFKRPVAVLVDGWTQGAAERAAEGFGHLGNAFLVGTPTAGSATVPATTTLAHCGVQVQVAASAQAVPTGRRVVPKFGVVGTASPAGDPMLEVALRLLEAANP